MSRTSDRSWWPVAIYAAIFEVVALVIGYLLTGPPKSMVGTHSFKATPTVGMPSISQLLDGTHQASAQFFMNGKLLAVGLIWTLITFLLYTLGNAYYISLLSRQVREREGTPGDDAKGSFLTLFGWMVVQFVISVLTLPVVMFIPIVGGVAVMVFLLWFRYHFLFLEYTAVILRRPFSEAWKLAPQIRKHVGGEAASYFFWTIGLNIVIGYVVNLLFSWPVVLLLLVVNAFVMTYLQRRVLEAFYNGVDHLKFENWQP
jgi:hypothetical protein